MITDETLQLIKDRAKINEVIADFIPLKKQGANYVGLCPFHTEKSPSFTVSPVKNIYKCFGCGRQGDAISFIAESQNKSFLEALKYLAEKYNIPLEEFATKNYTRPLPRLEKVSQKVIAWFEARKITNNTLLRFNITEALEWMPKIEKEVNSICFNYFRDGELINIKFRDASKNFKLSKDSERIFYNLDSIKEEEEATIVEGEIDCLSFYEAGVYACVSVPNGASKGNQNLDYLDNCYNYFSSKKKVVIAVDNDGPGKLLKEELARRIGKEKCYTVDWPEDCKDANDVLVKHGSAVLKLIYENAKIWPLEGELTINDMGDTLLDYYQNGYPPGYAAGITNFDSLLTFYPGQLTMITGIPGSGKDEFLNYIAVGLAERHQWKFGILGFEEPPEITVTKILEKKNKKSFAFRRDIGQRMTTEQFERGLMFTHEYFKFINTDEIDITIDGIVTKITELVERYGINAVIISPWNCIEHKIPRGYSETQYIGEALQKLLVCLKKRGIHGFLVAHPTKIQKDKKTGKYEIPTLYSINGSANFYNKTFNGITVWRDFNTNIVDIYIQKVKWSWLGKIGFCSFTFNTMTRQYEALNNNAVMPGSFNTSTQFDED